MTLLPLVPLAVTRIKADDTKSPSYVTCVLSDTAWERVEKGRDVITRAIESGKVSWEF